MLVGNEINRRKFNKGIRNHRHRLKGIIRNTSAFMVDKRIGRGRALMRQRYGRASLQECQNIRIKRGRICRAKGRIRKESKFVLEKHTKNFDNSIRWIRITGIGTPGDKGPDPLIIAIMNSLVVG